MAALSSSSSHIILRHVFRSPPPPFTTPCLSSFSLFKHAQTTPLLITSSFASLSSRTLCFSHSFSSSPSLSPPRSLSFINSETQIPITNKDCDVINSYDDGDDETESGNDGLESENEGLNRVLDASVFETDKELLSKLPSLTVKEKKELASYAHSLGKKLKFQQVGKSGVTDSVTAALIDTLEANELLKVKIHGSCPKELDDAVKQLEQATGSVVVGQIGRTVILYRPSLSKLKAEEKRKQARRVFVKKQSAFKPSLQNKEQLSRPSARGRRRMSRF